MKSITSKLLLIVGSATLLFSIFLFYRTYTLTDRRVTEVIEQQAAIALQFDVSLRNYVEQSIRPLMYQLVGEDEFIAEAMSTSYVARAVFEDVRKEFPDYIIKFSSDNPRNPSNQAGPEELAIISQFNEDPKLKRWSGEIHVGGELYFARFRARRMQESCLRCHGGPSEAPASLIKRYGATAGFHRPLGQVVGLDMVAIPVAKAKTHLWSESSKTFLSSLGVLLLFFFSVTVSMSFLITRRLARISRHFVKGANRSDYKDIETIEMGGGDEISDLASSYNVLVGKLRSFYDSLDQKVTERTQEIEEKNALLKHEIADRERAEETLRFTQFAIDHVSDSAFFHGPDGRFVYVNKAACRSLGYSQEELLSMSVHDVDSRFLSDSWSDHWEDLKRLGSFVFEAEHRAKDGRQYPVEMSVNYLEFKGRGFNCAFARDITKRKKEAKEREQLETQLQRARKMEAIGTLAGGVAHDLNNILSGIVSYPDLLLMQIPQDSPMRKPLGTIQETGKKAAAIVQDLLTLARRGVAVTEVANLNAITSTYLQSPEHEKTMSFHPSVRVETNLAPDLMNIVGSPVHLSKTVMNLVSNAAEAMPEGGRILITTYNKYADRETEGYEDIREGDYAVLEVSDTGVGISPEDKERIFEPFYSKKIMGRSGTGLGMAVIWGSVKDHKGYIDVQSTERGGTTFTLYFPATRKIMPEQESPHSLDKLRGEGQRILVVDDIKEQREIAHSILTELGYSVSTAAGGEEAIEYVKGNRVDLLVLDMIMDPGMDGLETYRLIAELNPGQKALIASGFSETDRVKQALSLGAGQYIKKPYTLEKIALAVKKELGG